MSKNVLITGGAGYVGSMLVPSLLEEGFTVTVVDLMIYGEDVLPKHPNLKVYRLDIRDINKLSQLLVKQNIVIHLACISNDPSFELNPELGKSINLDAFEPMVKAAKGAGVKRFIYASSSSVYGIKDVEDVSEDMSLEPLTDYSKFKAQCEMILNNYSSDDFTTTTIRPATVCGYAPRQRLDVVMNIFANNAYHKKEISVFGGSQLRPNINIKDMVRAYHAVIDAEKEVVNKNIYNVGDKNFTVLELAKMTKEVIGDDVSLVQTESNDNRSYHVSSKKILKDLGFKPENPLKEAIIDLKVAFESGLLDDPLNNPKYYNIKTMQKINLK